MPGVPVAAAPQQHDIRTTLPSYPLSPPQRMIVPVTNNTQQANTASQQRQLLLEQQLQLALDVLDRSTTAAYRQAVEEAPHVVRTESRPWYFLQAANYHPAAAAKRLAMYWQTRQE